MQSRIAETLKLRHLPVAVEFTNTKPEGAIQFAPGKWGCAVSMHHAAAKGSTVAFDRSTYGCPGGGVALCFGDRYATDFPDIAGFLSTGTDRREGEFYFQSPEIARAFLDQMPMADIPYEYVVFRPLRDVTDADDPPVLVNLYANPDQLSALVVLANYGRASYDNVVARMGAGCHTLCTLPYHESLRDPQRAVIGLFDITARTRTDADVLSFSIPFRMFQEMEASVPGSFLEKHDWQKVRARIPEPGR